MCKMINRLNQAKAHCSNHVRRRYYQFFKSTIEALWMNAGRCFPRMFATDNILVIGKQIVKKTFGYTTDGKEYQQ